jgi:hemerythrin-like domain-containing protein
MTMTAHAKDNGGDALDVLRQDHQAVRKLFLQYARFKPGALSGDGKIDVIQNLCRALAVHAQIEEELFYPALREAGEKDRVPVETGAEHATIRRLAEELRNAKPGDELADAKMKVLADYVQQHVDEEESELFSEARAAGFDLRALGEQLNARKAELAATEADVTGERGNRSPPPRSEPAAAQA